MRSVVFCSRQTSHQNINIIFWKRKREIRINIKIGYYEENVREFSIVTRFVIYNIIINYIKNNYKSKFKSERGRKKIFGNSFKKKVKMEPEKNSTDVTKNISTNKRREELEFEQKKWPDGSLTPIWGVEEDITTAEWGEDIKIIYEESREEEQAAKHVRVTGDVRESSIEKHSLPARVWAGGRSGKKVASSIIIHINSSYRE